MLCQTSQKRDSTVSEFEIIRATIAVGMISVATNYDVKTRYVDDRVWVLAWALLQQYLWFSFWYLEQAFRN